MSNYKYTQEQIKWIIDHYSNMPMNDFCMAFNKMFDTKISKKALQCKCQSLGVMSQSCFSNKEIEWVKSNYHNFNNWDEVCAAFNTIFHPHRITSDIMKNFAYNHKLKFHDTRKYSDKENNWIKENFDNYKLYKELTDAFNGVFGCNVTHRSISWHCNNILGLRKSQNELQKPVGNIRSFNGRLYIKTRNVKNERDYKGYEPLSRVIYEKYFGKIDRTKNVIVFKDGDPNNLNIDNLICVSKKAMAVMSNHQWWSEDIELNGLNLEYLKIVDELHSCIYQIDRNTESIINIFDTIADANEFLGKQRGSSNISNVCNGRSKTAYGYKWAYGYNKTSIS